MSWWTFLFEQSEEDLQDRIDRLEAKVETLKSVIYATKEAPRVYADEYIEKQSELCYLKKKLERLRATHAQQ